MSRKRMAAEIGIVLAVLVGGVCLTIWGAGVLAARLTGLVPLEADRFLGEQVARASRATATVCDSEATQQYVQAVAQPLLDALEDDRFRFEFVVVNDPAVNAFAAPGGFVTINMGLLKSAQSGDEVAAVLAHEIQHVVQRHVTQRVLRQMGGTTVLYLLFGGTDIAVPASVMSDFLHTAFDRDQEQEADEEGRALMKRAGIDPRGMARFFERLSEQSVAPPEIVSTHPDPGNRARAAHEAAEGFVATRSLPPPGAHPCRAGR